MDVIPWQEDLTKALKSGENSINYKALFNGQTYTPVNRANAPKNAIPPSITMNSYLIFWE